MRNHDFNGCLRHALTQRVWSFGGVLKMLNIMKRQIAGYGALQATCRERTWAADVFAAHAEGDTDMPAKKTQEDMPLGAPSFLVRVHYCQGATWQGTIQWLETGRTTPFRSTLEMIHLMEQVVAKQLPETEDEEEAGWGEL